MNDVRAWYLHQLEFSSVRNVLCYKMPWSIRICSSQETSSTIITKVKRDSNYRGDPISFAYGKSWVISGKNWQIWYLKLNTENYVN